LEGLRLGFWLGGVGPGGPLRRVVEVVEVIREWAILHIVFFFALDLQQVIDFQKSKNGLSSILVNYWMGRALSLKKNLAV
jgi:hypothetical protein